MANTCIVVANEPRAYREAFAVVLQELRPHLEVICMEPDDLDGMAVHGRPRLVLCSQLTEAVQMCCEAWILLYPNGKNRALISVAGRWTVVTTIAFPDLLSVIDELEPPAQ